MLYCVPKGTNQKESTMQTYNSFNELATANATSPLISDMSVFNNIESIRASLNRAADVYKTAVKSIQGQIRQEIEYSSGDREKIKKLETMYIDLYRIVSEINDACRDPR
jgi:hypothetical protein